MKNKYRFLVLASLFSCAAQAQLQVGVLSRAITTMVPTALITDSSAGVSSADRNDIILIKNDAMIALETGVVSDELASVMERMQTVDSTLSGLTDEQLLLVIIQTN